MAELTDVKGIGPAKAETLAEEGYESVEDLANADRDELASISGVGEERALEYIVGAADLLEDGDSEESPEEESSFDLTPEEVGEELEQEEDEEEDEPSTEEQAEEIVEEVEEEMEEEAEPGPYPVHIDFETRRQYHTFHAAVMRYHERIITSNQPAADAMQKVLDGLTDVEGVEYELSEAELNTLHTAVKQARTDYQGNNLIDHMDELREVEQQINDQRREYLF